MRIWVLILLVHISDLSLKRKTCVHEHLHYRGLRLRPCTSCQCTSTSNETVHNLLISPAGNRVLKINSNGSACIFAVSVNANESTGAAGFSDRRNAHRMKAVLIKSDLFATCSPGQILRVAASRVYMLHPNDCPTCDQSRMCRNSGRPAPSRLWPTSAEVQICRDSGRPLGRWQSP